MIVHRSPHVGCTNRWRMNLNERNCLRKRFLLLTATLLLAFSWLPSLRAASLQSLFDGAFLTVGNCRFDNWQLLSGSNSAGAPLNYGLMSMNVLAGGIGLLKLRSWGRRILIGATWLALAGTLIGQPIYLWKFITVFEPNGPSIGSFKIVILIVGLLQLAFSAFILGLMLRALHGSRIREAIAAKEAMLKATASATVRGG